VSTAEQRGNALLDSAHYRDGNGRSTRFRETTAMRKPRKTGNWMQRRVCFLVSDAYHKVTPVTITMPVRVKGRNGDGVSVYEGPIDTMWEKHVSPRINTSILAVSLSIRQHDLVGVLIASTESLDEGTINWMEQSEQGTSEAGADHIKQVA
jgi:hypothetical protein